MEEEYLPLLKNKKTLYMEETDNLLQSRKREMASDLYGIVENLKSKKNITEFIESKIDYLDNTKLFYSDINDNKNSCILFFIIKIIGFFFLTTYLIGIFQLIGIKDSLEEETFDSIIFFLKEIEIITLLLFIKNYIQIIQRNYQDLHYFLLCLFYLR